MPNTSLDEKLEELISDIFLSIPEKERKEIKLGNQLEFNLLTFNFDSLCKLRKEEIECYSSYIKKIVYEILLLVKEHKLHLLTSSWYSVTARLALSIPKILLPDTREAWLLEYFKKLDYVLWLPVVFDFQTYQLCKKIIKFVNCLLKNHTYKKEISEYLSDGIKRLDTYERKLAYKQQEYIDDLFIQLMRSLEDLKYEDLHNLITVTLLQAFNRLLEEISQEGENVDPRKMLILHDIHVKTHKLLIKIKDDKNVSSLDKARIPLEKIFEKSKSYFSKDEDKKEESNRIISPIKEDKEKEDEVKEGQEMLLKKSDFAKRLKEFATYEMQLNMLEIMNQQPVRKPLEQFYFFKSLKFFTELQEDFNFLDKPFQQLKDEQLLYSYSLTTEDLQRIQGIELQLNTAKKLLTPTANGLLEILNQINGSQSSLENKKQFAKQIVRYHVSKISSLVELAKLSALLNQKDFIRQKRGLLKNRIIFHGETASFKFILRIIQQKIQKLSGNPKEIAKLSEHEKTQINKIMNYKKGIFAESFDINNHHFQSFSVNLQYKYHQNDQHLFSRKKTKEYQKKLFIKMIQLLDDIHLSCEEAKQIQQDFLRNDLAYVIKSIQFDNGQKCSARYLMNAICKDIIKFKKHNASFDCAAAMVRIQKNYNLLLKIFSGLPSLNNIIQAMQHSQHNYIIRLRGLS